jgi:hypothetical protein
LRLAELIRGQRGKYGNGPAGAWVAFWAGSGFGCRTHRPQQLEAFAADRAIVFI